MTKAIFVLVLAFQSVTLIASRDMLEFKALLRRYCVVNSVAVILTMVVSCVTGRREIGFD